MLDLFETTWAELWAGHEQQKAVGAIFTRHEMVDLILDLAGYLPGARRLASMRVLEPSCGDGAFVSRVVRRLVESEIQHASSMGWADPVLDHSVRAADISTQSLDAARATIRGELTAAGCPEARAVALAARWAVHTDFLLHAWEGRYDLVVGNPPYVRIEDLPKPVLDRYRAVFSTVGDRADLYVAFLERGLQLIAESGVLAFITANRFAKNLYGRRLRKLIADRYHVRYYVNLEHTQPFLSEVSAYPAIVVIDRDVGKPTRAATLDDIRPATLNAVGASVFDTELVSDVVTEFPAWYPDGGLWLTTSGEEHRSLHRLNGSLPALEQSAPGTRVGIGVATGADRVFILSERSKQIEDDRQIPLLMASNIGNDAITWSGKYLLNPFAPSGDLIALADYQGLAAHLERHASRLKERHVAKTRPHAWYRTIDRIWPELQHKAKLVMPDIQVADAPTIGLEGGSLYPHHNVYWITSDSWDLRALKALLRSTISVRQVGAYSVQMRGGSVRWQAQTLRRVRVPLLRSLTDAILVRLIGVADSTRQAEIDEVAEEAYGTFLTS